MARLFGDETDVEQRPGESLPRSLAAAFRAGGEELYLVGGAVRDGLLGLAGSDLDFATSAIPERSARLLESLNLGTPYRVGERFGTVGLAADGLLIEVTTFRSRETYSTGSRKPAVEFGSSLRQDLARRDFTVNAMGLDPLTGDLIDPYGGQSDLATRVLRAVGNAPERFAEDPLRLLRAVRFASRLNFEIERETWRALLVHAPSLSSISRERIRDEYSRILTGKHPLEGLALLRDGNLLAYSVPQLLELTTMRDHGPHHQLSLWDHTLRVVETVPADVTLRWAALLHDIGKPATRSLDEDGRPRFFQHEVVGARLARAILRGLRYPSKLVDDVTLLVETHMQFHAYSREWSDGAVRRFLSRMGPLIGAGLALARADAAAHVLTGESRNAPRYDELQARVEAVSREPPRRRESPLTGHDLMERFGLSPGPKVGQIKSALREEVIEGTLDPDDMASAWRLAEEFMRGDSAER